ncbi:MAG TPA: MFS transporter [Candidatus Acidoferrum sp.]|nr:MFS transporter [Candidatus Acidoferrum sp.]
MAASDTSSAAGRIAFTYPNFVLFQLARFFMTLSGEMQSVAVGWEVYEITKRPLALGFVGLAQFLPAFLLFLVSGHAADRYDRRKLMFGCYCASAACSAALLFLTLRGHRSPDPIYAVLALLGVARSFSGPATRSLLPQLVPAKDFQNAVAWASVFFQGTVILSPSVGGIIYAITGGPATVYTLSFVTALAAAACTLKIKVESAERTPEPLNWKTTLAGLSYIWREKAILGSISLDLFAVLLGGAVALLPIYAKEILLTGPWGLGLLRSAPAVGAAVMAILLAHKPLGRHAGTRMLWCVAGFGLATIFFGLSRNLLVSLLALFLVGATDMVSVMVRQLLIQLGTPDEMRGRVNAVDSVFIGASNELGQFESGLTAHWFGTVRAVVLGGAGAILVTGLWAWWFPELRQARETPKFAD